MYLVAGVRVCRAACVRQFIEVHLGIVLLNLRNYRETDVLVPGTLDEKVQLGLQCTESAVFI